jgi:hypothetical protein
MRFNAGSDFPGLWARPGAGGGAGNRAMLAALCGPFPGKEKPGGLGRARWGWVLGYQAAQLRTT